MKRIIYSKPVLKSLTMVFNAVAALVMLGDWMVGEGLSVTTEPAFGAALVLGNALLRLRTKLPVTVTGGDAVQVDQPDDKPPQGAP